MTGSGVEAPEPVPLRVRVLRVQPRVAEPMEFHRAAGGSQDQVAVRIQGQAVGGAAAVDDARSFPNVLKSRQQILFGPQMA